MPSYDELQLAALIRSLPPAPEAWVAAAQELPRAGKGLSQILALAKANAEFNQALIDDLESALQKAGIDPKPRLVDELRARLAGQQTKPDA